MTDAHATPQESNLVNIDFDRLWNRVSAQFAGQEHSLHGPNHWRRVERNGVLIAEQSGANVVIVRLFALFHDSRRINEGWDPDHGQRGAEFAASLRGIAFDLVDSDFEILHYACTWHTDGEYHEDCTIATCWDADRLDLGRVGIIPDPTRMCTSMGRTLAQTETFDFHLGDA